VGVWVGLGVVVGEGVAVGEGLGVWVGVGEGVDEGEGTGVGVTGGKSNRALRGVTGTTVEASASANEVGGR
jgi:hypothetical protein